MKTFYKSIQISTVCALLVVGILSSGCSEGEDKKEPKTASNKELYQQAIKSGDIPKVIQSLEALVKDPTVRGENKEMYQQTANFLRYHVKLRDKSAVEKAVEPITKIPFVDQYLDYRKAQENAKEAKKLLEDARTFAGISRHFDIQRTLTAQEILQKQFDSSVYATHRLLFSELLPESYNEFSLSYSEAHFARLRKIDSLGDVRRSLQNLADCSESLGNLAQQRVYKRMLRVLSGEKMYIKSYIDVDEAVKKMFEAENLELQKNNRKPESSGNRTGEMRIVNTFTLANKVQGDGNEKLSLGNADTLCWVIVEHKVKEPSYRLVEDCDSCNERNPKFSLHAFIKIYNAWELLSRDVSQEEIIQQYFPGDPQFLNKARNGFKIFTSDSSKGRNGRNLEGIVMPYSFVLDSVKKRSNKDSILLSLGFRVYAPVFDHSFRRVFSIDTLQHIVEATFDGMTDTIKYRRSIAYRKEAQNILQGSFNNLIVTVEKNSLFAREQWEEIWKFDPGLREYTRLSESKKRIAHKIVVSRADGSYPRGVEVTKMK